MTRARKQEGEGESRDHRKVEEDRRGGRGPEPVVRVEHRRYERHEGDESQIRKGDPGEGDRERKGRGLVVEPGRQHADEGRHEGERDREQHELDA